MKQESQLVTYAAGPLKSTVDYIIMRQEDKALNSKTYALTPGLHWHQYLEWMKLESPNFVHR